MAWFCEISVTFGDICYILGFCELKIGGDIESKVKKWPLQKEYICWFFGLKILPQSKLLCRKWTYRDLPNTKQKEFQQEFQWTCQIWDSCLFWSIKKFLLIPFAKVLDKQSQLMNSPCGDPNKELNHKEENQK